MTTTDAMTAADAAERLKVSVSTVLRMAGDGRLKPALKFPGETGPYLFERAEVERAAAKLAAAQRAKVPDAPEMEATA